jgi:TPR repeat protein
VQDYGQAMHWFTKTADKGFVAALTFIGNCYSEGYQDYEKAIEYFQRAIDKDDAGAYYYLGSLYWAA